MKKYTIAILVYLLVSGTTTAYAGWYACYNFKGVIGKYPISLSIQLTEGYYGEENKKDLNLTGVYKYEKYNEVIRLEGKLDLETKRVLLYELAENKRIATLEFGFSEMECKGLWKSTATKKVLHLQLSFISKLIDTLKENTFAGIEILQSGSLPDFYFVGIYSKSALDNKAQMDRLQIVRKNNNAVFQTIDLSVIESKSGNISTIIYDNVQVQDAIAGIINVWNDIGRMGGFLTIAFNYTKQSFELNPVPQIDGPD